MKKVMLDCETAAFVVTRHLAKQSTVRNKMSMYMHIMACPGCRRYYHQQKTISEHLQKVAHGANGSLSIRHLNADEIRGLDQFISGHIRNSWSE